MISAISNTAGTTAQGAAGATAAPGSGTDFDTFLKMLTSQLKNQNPLNPMEGTDFAVQLATFSGVEQQAQTNKLLAQMVAQMGGGGGLGQMAEMIGKEARTTSAVKFGDKALTLDLSPDPAADSVTLVTLNGSGQVISREEIGPGSGQIDWFGRDDLGAKLPDGQYSFITESLREGEVIREDPVGVYARIVEAEAGEDGTRLIFEGGASALASEIDALREAS